MSDNAVQVCGQIFLESLEKSFRIINRFTISYRIIGGELKMVHQHNTYEYMQPSESRILNLDMNTMQFVRSLLLDRLRAAYAGTQRDTDHFCQSEYGFICTEPAQENRVRLY